MGIYGKGHTSKGTCNLENGSHCKVSELGPCIFCLYVH